MVQSYTRAIVAHISEEIYAGPDRMTSNYQCVQYIVMTNYCINIRNVINVILRRYLNLTAQILTYRETSRKRTIQTHVSLVFVYLFEQMLHSVHFAYFEATLD